MLEKGACELFMHGTIESSSTDVHQTFNTSLNASLRLQDEIYSKMQSKGWYPTEQVQQRTGISKGRKGNLPSFSISCCGFPHLNSIPFLS